MKSLVLVFFALLSDFAFAQNSPNISANALLLYQNSNLNRDDASPNRNGFDLREAEIAFYSEVDPYHKLNILITIVPEYKFDTASQSIQQTWLVEPETLYVDSTSVSGVLLRLGKFKAAFGKHNQLHSHSFPFIEAPLVNSKLLGPEGLNDVGASVAALLPINWFSEITLQALRGEGENEEFNSPANGDVVGLVRWANLIETSSDSTFELGVSGAQGQNYLRTSTILSGADLTFKWRPTEGGKYRSAIVALEAIRRTLEQPGTNSESSQGVSLWGQYQFLQRWSAGLRIETLSTQGAADPITRPLALPNKKSSRSAAALVFAPTEFSSYRLEFGQGKLPLNANGEADEKRVFLQANFTIGAHPAHAY